MPQQLRASYQQIQSPVNSGRQPPANIGTAYSPRTAAQQTTKGKHRGVSLGDNGQQMTHEGQILAYNTQAPQQKVMNSTQRFSPQHGDATMSKFYKGAAGQDALAYLNVATPISKQQMQSSKRQGTRSGTQQQL